MVTGVDYRWTVNLDRRPGLLPAAGAPGPARRDQHAASYASTRLLPTTPEGPSYPSRGRSAGAPSPQRPPSRAPRPGFWSVVPVGVRLLALLVAVAAAVGTFVVWEVFVATRTGQVVEDYAYDGALTGRTRLWTVAEPVLGVVLSLIHI